MKRRAVSSGHQSALNYAYRLLSYRDRSEKEIAERLRTKGFDEYAINTAVNQLKSNGLLDDRKLASFLKRYAEESKQMSIRGTRNFLLKRGVPADIVNETIKDSDEVKTAKRLVEKKIRAMTKLNPSDSFQPADGIITKKLYGILFRRGYSPETISKTLRQLRIKEDMV